jgi:hypothetical protein
MYRTVRQESTANGVPIVNLVEATITEARLATPNLSKIGRLLSPVGQLVQTAGTGSGAYELVRASAASAGIVLPDLPKLT